MRFASGMAFFSSLKSVIRDCPDFDTKMPEFSGPIRCELHHNHLLTKSLRYLVELGWNRGNHCPSTTGKMEERVIRCTTENTNNQR